MRRLAWAATFAALVAITVAVVSAPVRPADRAAALASELRCPVCQNESVLQSQAPTAASMRKVIAEQIAAGKSDAEIKQFFIDRYGTWILLDPAQRSGTALLWLLPIGLAGLGLGFVAGRRRRPGHASVPGKLEADTTLPA